MQKKRSLTGGFTLIELIVSLGIMMLGIVATSVMLLEGSRMARNAEEIAQSNESARFPAEYVLYNARLAGFGASGGVWINQAGAPRRINPVFGTDGDGGSDDIWMVVPGRGVLREACVEPGSAAIVVSRSASTDPISVNCTGQVLAHTIDGGIPANYKLLAGDLNQASLLTGIGEPTPGAPGTISYAGSGVLPPRGAFNPGDFVYPARVLHFFIGRAPDDAGTALYMADGNVNPLPSPALPFVDSPSDVALISRDAEDLQIAYGIDVNRRSNPDEYSFANELRPNFDPALPLRALRVTVVAHGRRISLRSDATGLTDDVTYSPGYYPDAGFTIENRTAGFASDGFRRSLYQRRVDPPNLSPGAL